MSAKTDAKAATTADAKAATTADAAAATTAGTKAATTAAAKAGTKADAKRGPRIEGKAETKGDRTRARLTAATATLLQRQGYHGTGLAEIVAESGAPRGSLYFYFPGGKEELACAALRASGNEWRRRLETVIDEQPDLGQAITAVCAELAVELASSDFAQGCPLATVALEASVTSDAVRATVAAHYQSWIDAIGARLVAHGFGAAAARRIAGFALAAIEGGLLLAKVTRSIAPLREVGETLRLMVSSLPGPTNRVA